MRDATTDFCSAAWGNLSVEHAESSSWGLAGVTEPERKSHSIGEDLCACRSA